MTVGAARIPLAGRARPAVGHRRPPSGACNDERGWHDERVQGRLIDLDTARQRVLAAAIPLAKEAVALGESLGRVLGEDVPSDGDIPPFDCSAMDGYAVRAGPPAELRLAAESRAGHPADRPLAPGEAFEISTGAQVPAGADAVVPVELAERRDDAVSVPRSKVGDHVRRAGEDVRGGATVLEAGTTIGPAELGVLAAVGRPQVTCGARPRVAVIVTGDELRAPGEALGPGQIRDANAYTLTAQAQGAGAEVVTRAIVPDEPQATRQALGRALEEADMVCISGGVSVGRHDHVKPALAELGVDERFWGVALKPGKPTWFGVRERRLVLGLPGNPVSAMVTFHLFARPALRRLAGAEPRERWARATLDEPVRRSEDRDQVLRCRLTVHDDGWHVAPTGQQGSHVLTSMLAADAFALVPAGPGELRQGDRVDIEILRQPSAMLL